MLLLLTLAGTSLVYPKPMPKTQLTLAFGAPTLQLSSAPPPTSALQSALARPPSNAAGQTQAVVAPPAAAAGSSGVTKIVVDQKRPVMAKLKVGPNAELEMVQRAGADSDDEGRRREMPQWGPRGPCAGPAGPRGG
ncbi:hypothetical protein EMIHUDRAFT_217404 [Emiliania huxleyi CCMP1516]|uniref:Ubiquitin-like domain-containing protein n=2 Tax=Emiliania huxleyi TaxID=2903 RepID=A0A0D3IBM5_EMIH1|nr:hypothetical protein EMIHUDRAFT_217404 [Emiliania huxleyi CCMP1516]EOD08660.1 hypothetical protein EMIHUDRAFT_217404 [Emiliania huxleyi CCMP1516]|eukprot:XP_005761089.1 hypothetical protein EMIHUDRAFT_217404 [Emiliania huxleyi CCMP1516]